MSPLESLKSRLRRKGYALGQPDIFNDSIEFVYDDEIYSIPTIDAVQLSRPNGSFYEAPVRKLRKYMKDLANG